MNPLWIIVAYAIGGGLAVLILYLVFDRKDSK